MIAFITGAVRTWVAIYTIGLAGTVKESRRNEIESDLWEQQRVALIEDERTLDTAIHIFTRWVLGLPADIFWRAETTLAGREEREGRVIESKTSRIGLLVGI